MVCPRLRSSNTEHERSKDVVLNISCSCISFATLDSTWPFQQICSGVERGLWWAAQRIHWAFRATLAGVQKQIMLKNRSPKNILRYPSAQLCRRSKKRKRAFRVGAIHGSRTHGYSLSAYIHIYIMISDNALPKRVGK